MKKAATGLAALAMMTAPAFAGGMDEPIMEPTIAPEVIEEDTASSADDQILVPLTALVLFGIAVSN